MGELVFIGLGLDDERGITLRGLEEARTADLVFAEFYTSTLPGASIEAVEKLIDRQIRRLSKGGGGRPDPPRRDRKSTRLNSSHLVISYAVFCLKKKKKKKRQNSAPTHNSTLHST